MLSTRTLSKADFLKQNDLKCFRATDNTNF